MAAARNAAGDTFFVYGQRQSDVTEANYGNLRLVILNSGYKIHGM